MAQNWLADPFNTSTPTRTRTNVDTTVTGSPRGEAAGSEWLGWQKDKMDAGAPVYAGPNPYAGGPNQWQQTQANTLGGLQSSYNSPTGWQAQYQNIGAQSPDQVAMMNRRGGVGPGYTNPYESQVVDALKRDSQDMRQNMFNQVGDGSNRNNAFGGDRQAVAEVVGGAEINKDVMAQLANVRGGGYSNAMNWFGQDQDRTARAIGQNNNANLAFNDQTLKAGQYDINNQMNFANAQGQYGNYQDNKNMMRDSWLKGNWDNRNTREDQWSRDYMSGVSGTPWENTSTTTGIQTGQGKSNFDKTLGTAIALGGAKMTFKCIPEGTKIDTQGGGQIAIEDIKAGTKVKGYYKAETEVLQVHQYKEDPAPHRFYHITFDNGGVVSCCDMHKIYNKRAKDYKVGDRIQNTKVTSITRYNGVERSYDLLTADGGYLIGGVPVNSMIEELAELAFELKQSAEAA